MSDRLDRELALESMVRKVTKDLPLRHAPHSLEVRVLARIKSRGFATWRPAVQVSFVIASCMAMAGVLWAGAGTFDGATLHVLSVLRFMTSFGAISPALAALVPTDWLYIGLGIGAALYAALLGLGAMAYHTLYLQPANSR